MNEHSGRDLRDRVAVIQAQYLAARFVRTNEIAFDAILLGSVPRDDNALSDVAGDHVAGKIKGACTIRSDVIANDSVMRDALRVNVLHKDAGKHISRNQVPTLFASVSNPVFLRLLDTYAVGVGHGFGALLLRPGMVAIYFVQSRFFAFDEDSGFFIAGDNVPLQFMQSPKGVRRDVDQVNTCRGARFRHDKTSTYEYRRERGRWRPSR